MTTNTTDKAKEIQMDWQQVAENGGPPCFAILDDEDGWYCGRAERWEGHDGDHRFVSLAALRNEAYQEGVEAVVKMIQTRRDRYALVRGIEAETIRMVSDRLLGEARNLLPAGPVDESEVKV